MRAAVPTTLRPTVGRHPVTVVSPVPSGQSWRRWEVERWVGITNQGRRSASATPTGSPPLAERFSLGATLQRFLQWNKMLKRYCWSRLRVPPTRQIAAESH